MLVDKTLVCPSNPGEEDLNAIVSTVEDDGVTRSGKSYSELVATISLNPLLAVQDGGSIQKSGSRVTKLVVVTSRVNADEFALVFSMSHVAADGHDYYKIYYQLSDTSAPILSLNPIRVIEYEERESEWTGASDFAWISGGLGLLKGMIGGWAFGPKAEWVCYEVDEDKVAAKKAEEASKVGKGGEGGVDFVSTNDVITSHMGKCAGVRTLMMIVNMRDKIALPITDSNAGCYEGCLLLDPENYETPSRVRECINGGVPYTRQTESAPLPGLCSSNPMGLITSWSSFPFSISMPGVTEQILHLPAIKMPDMMDVGIVFKPRPGKLAVLYFAKRARGKLKVEGEEGILGNGMEVVSLFPSCG